MEFSKRRDVRAFVARGFGLESRPTGVVTTTSRAVQSRPPRPCLALGAALTGGGGGHDDVDGTRLVYNTLVIKEEGPSKRSWNSYVSSVPDSHTPTVGPPEPEGNRHEAASLAWLPPWDNPEDPGAGQRRLVRLLETGPQPFAAIDLEARIVQVNRAFSALVGYSQEELLGMSVLDLTAPQSLAVTRRAHAEILATGETRRVVKKYRRKDGSEVPVELIIDMARDDDGQPMGLYAFITDITERARAEEALQDSEERFRRLYDEAPVGYTEYDAEGRILSINRTLCELLGYDKQDLLGKEVFEIVVPEEREDARRVLREKMEGTRPLLPFQRALLKSDGGRLIAEIHQRERRDAQGRITGIRSVVKDISQRLQTEVALVESERRARALFDGIHDAVFVHDQAGRILDANPAACRMLGYTREELMGMTTSQVDAPEFACGFEDRLMRQLEQGRLSCEGLYRTKNGRVIPVEITTSTIHYDNQIAILAILRDITERKALERTRREFAAAQMRNAQDMEIKNRALSESETRYRQLAEGSLDAIVVADGNGRITLFNPAAEKIFGYASDEILGQPLVRLIPELFKTPNLAEAPRSDGATAAVGTYSPGTARLQTEDEGPLPDPMAGGQSEPIADASFQLSPMAGKTVELVGRRSDRSEFPLELSLSAVETSGRLQYIGAIRDQTERQRMRAMLAHSDKLASIGLLSAGVAHEINNPLAYVGNNLVVLQRDVRGLLRMLELYESARAGLEPSGHDVLRVIDEHADEIDMPYIRENVEKMIDRTREGVRRVANIVQNLRGLARTTPPQWEWVSFADLLENALEMMRGRLKHQRVDVVVQNPAEIRLDCVPSQICQVLLNLLINALQAIEAKGRQEGGRIEVEASLSAPWVVIAIRDNGCGIDPKDLDQLFDPFFTTKPVGEGTGLGLAISHGIISGHGGRIEVESRPSEGSTFRILLPQHQAPNVAKG